MTSPELKSWRDGPALTAIHRFAMQATSASGPDFVPEEDRIAVFSHDGVLWSRYPLPAELSFAQSRLRTLAAQSPSLWERPIFQQFLNRDPAVVQALGPRSLYAALTAIHAGEPLDAYRAGAAEWVATSAHPAFILPFARLVYQPQRELLAFLRTRGFRCFIVSSGDAAFIRAVSSALYDLPPEQVIGSSPNLEMRAEVTPTLIRGAEIARFNHGTAKVESIEQHTGRRPTFAFGGSDSDLPMLRRATGGPGAGLGLLLHHDDAEREAAYDREYALAPLVEGLSRAAELRITTVSMRHDWFTPFV